MDSKPLYWTMRNLSERDAGGLLRRQWWMWLRVMTLLLALSATPRADDSPAHHVLKPEDTIVMTVFGEDSLTTRTKILKSGEAVLPLIGSVKLGGLTVPQATQLVRDLYNKDYLVEPKVTITVDAYAQEYVTVSGAVMTPGTVTIPAGGKLDLATAVISCGGLSPTADPQKILLIRASGETRLFTAAVLTQTERIPLSPGDKVVVSESAFVGKSVLVQGRVRKPGPVVFPPDGQLDVLTAIALAGGLHELASPKRVEINRKGKVIKINVQEMSEKGNSRFALQPDDIITVPERWF